MKVRVNATKEAVFGEEGVEIKKVSFKGDKSNVGELTGTTLAGFCEVEMPALDDRKHWYPIDGLEGENGEKIVEEEVVFDMEEDDSLEKE